MQRWRSRGCSSTLVLFRQGGRGANERGALGVQCVVPGGNVWGEQTADGRRGHGQGPAARGTDGGTLEQQPGVV